MVATVINFVKNLFTGGSSAPNSETSLAAAGVKDYDLVLSILTPFASQGDVCAQTMLGVTYKDKSGLPADHEMAVKWLTLAANCCYAEAQHHLALMFYDGLGVEQDFVKASQLLFYAASQGY